MCVSVEWIYKLMCHIFHYVYNVFTMQYGRHKFVYLFPLLHQLFMVTTASHWCVSYMLRIQVVELTGKSIQCVSSPQSSAIMKGVVNTLKAIK